MADTKTLKVFIKGDASSVQGASKKANKSLGTVGGAANKMGGALIGAFTGAVLIAGIGAAITKIAAFEKTMRRVAIISKGSEAELSNLAKTLGKTTVFTAIQAGDAMTFLAQAGFSANQILKATPGILELAAAAQLDLARAADIASNVLSAYGLEASKINEINDILVNTANSANTTVDQFAEAFKMVGPLAKSAGIDIQETAVQIGMLGNAGLQGSIAGTGLRATILALINPNAALRSAMASAGTEIIKNADGSLNLAESLKELKKTSLSAKDAAEAFGRIGLSSALVMIDGAVAADKLRASVAEIGTAAATAEQQMDTLSGDLDEMKSAFEGFVLNGGKFSDVLRQQAQSTTLWIQLFDAGLNPVLAQAIRLVTENGDAMLKLAGRTKELTSFQKQLVIAFAEDVKVLDEHGIALETLGVGLQNTSTWTQDSFERLQAWRAEIAKSRMPTEEETEALKKLNEQYRILSEQFGKETAKFETNRDFELWKEGQKAAEAYRESLVPIKIELAEIGDMEDEVADKMDDNAEAAARSKMANDKLAISQERLAIGIGQTTVNLAVLAAQGKLTATKVIAQLLAMASAFAIEKAMSDSKNPIIGLLIAGIALGGVATLFSSIEGFAQGGIVGGSSFAGDNVPIMVNSGEMILNRSQQASLLNGNAGGGVVVNVNGFVGNPTELAREISIVLNNESTNVSRTSFL